MMPPYKHCIRINSSHASTITTPHDLHVGIYLASDLPPVSKRRFRIRHLWILIFLGESGSHLAIAIAGPNESPCRTKRSDAYTI